MRRTKDGPKWWVNKRCREGKILVVVMLTWMLSLCRKQFGVPNCGDFEGIACNMCSTHMEGIPVITSPSSPSSSPLSSHLPPSSLSFSDSTVLCSAVLARRKPMPLCSL